jgi:hypothetical protein
VLLEDVDEKPTDGLALDLGVADPLQRAEEKLAFIRVDQRHVVMVAEHRHDLFRLTQPQKAVVDEDTGQLVTNRLVDQDGGHGRIHAPRQRADHLRVADLLPDLANRLLAVGAHRPVALEPRQPHEIRVKLRALGGVVDFGVKLDGVEMALGVGGDGEGGVGRSAIDVETRCDLRHMVAVRHPDLFGGLRPSVRREPAGQEGMGQRCGCHEGLAEFCRAMPTFDMAAKAVHHHLLTVADAKDRHAQIENPGRGHRRVLPVD